MIIICAPGSSQQSVAFDSGITLSQAVAKGKRHAGQQKWRTPQQKMI